MSIIPLLITVPLGLAVWYVLFGVECAINGAFGGWSMPFRELWKDITGECPYGLIHAAIMHVLIPSAPTLIWFLILKP